MTAMSSRPLSLASGLRSGATTTLPLPPLRVCAGPVSGPPQIQRSRPRRSPETEGPAPRGSDGKRRRGKGDDGGPPAITVRVSVCVRPRRGGRRRFNSHACAERGAPAGRSLDARHRGAPRRSAPVRAPSPGARPDTGRGRFEGGDEAILCGPTRPFYLRRTPVGVGPGRAARVLRHPPRGPWREAAPGRGGRRLRGEVAIGSSAEAAVLLGKDWTPWRKTETAPETTPKTVLDYPFRSQPT